jgi:hypothetical protein
MTDSGERDRSPQEELTMRRRFRPFRRAVDLLCGPPGVPFIGAMVALCLIVLVSCWTPGLMIDEYGLYSFSALVLATLMTVVRTPFTLARLRTTPAGVARVLTPPLLLAVMIVLLPSAERLRIALSRDDLDAYARTVTAVECDEKTFRPRRVGLYTVTCACRPIPSVVSLTIRDRFTPDDTGSWFLVGPGDWELGED